MARMLLLQSDPIKALNESPSEKEGKFLGDKHRVAIEVETLNESPSEKEGKCRWRELPNLYSHPQ